MEHMKARVRAPAQSSEDLSLWLLVAPVQKTPSNCHESDARALFDLAAIFFFFFKRQETIVVN